MYLKLKEKIVALEARAIHTVSYSPEDTRMLKKEIVRKIRYRNSQEDSVKN